VSRIAILGNPSPYEIPFETGEGSFSHNLAYLASQTCSIHSMFAEQSQ